jgi:hypothetical protein
MGLEVHDAKQAQARKLVADRALFVDASGVLVEAGEASAAIQVASRAGKTIPPAVVAAYDLRISKAGVVIQGEEKPVTVKEAKQPKQDKQRGGKTSAK